MYCHTFLLVVLSSVFSGLDGDHFERQLYVKLRDGYNKFARPVKNASHPVVVHLGLSLQQILEVDEKQERVQVNAWLDFAWNDFKLKWKMKEFGGISDVRFPLGEIWKPDILLHNSVDPNFDSTFHSNFLIYNSGTVTWIPPGIFFISCKIDITWFPFDDQTCFFKFGSWTHSGIQVDLQPGKFDVSDYIENGEWVLVSTMVNRTVKYYECCPEPYPELIFSMHLRRRTLYYAFNLIMPCLSTMLLTLLGFILPPDACEKITLQVTVLLAILFFLDNLSSMTPVTSEAFPLLGVFFSSCMAIVSASLVFTVYIMNLHFRTSGTHKMNYYSRIVLLNWLPWMLRIERPSHPLNWKTVRRSLRRKKTADSTIDTLKGEGGVDIGSRLQSAQQNEDVLDAEDGTRRLTACLRRLTDEQRAGGVHADAPLHARLLMLQRIHAQFATVTQRMHAEDRESADEEEWHFAALVIDRLCLILFSMFIVAVTGGIFLRAPYWDA